MERAVRTTVRPVGVRRRVARLLAVPAAALLLPVVLSGCTVRREAGTAATVGEVRVPVSRLQALTRELQSAGGAATLDPATQQAFPVGGLQRATLEKLISGALVTTAAGRRHVSISSGQLDTAVDALDAQLKQQQQYKTLGAYLTQTRNVPPSYTRQYVRDVLLSSKLGATLVPDDPSAAAGAQSQALLAKRQVVLNSLLTSTARSVGVEVNPRYGRWTAAQGTLSPLVSGGLAHASRG